MVLTTVLGPGSGKELHASLGWRGGYCHAILGGNAVLVQVEEHGLQRLGWPTRGFEHVDWGWVDPRELPRWIPYCPGIMVDVEELEIFGVSFGHGHQSMSGEGYWWLAIPAGTWKLQRQD